MADGVVGSRVAGLGSVRLPGSPSGRLKLADCCTMHVTHTRADIGGSSGWTRPPAVPHATARHGTSFATRVHDLDGADASNACLHLQARRISVS